MKYIAKFKVSRNNSIFFPSKPGFLENVVIQNFQINSIGSNQKYILLIFYWKVEVFHEIPKLLFFLIFIENIMVPVQCPNNSKFTYISTKNYFFSWKHCHQDSITNSCNLWEVF